MAHYVSTTSLTPTRPAPSPQTQRRGTTESSFSTSTALANSGYSSSFTGSSSPSISYNYSNGGIGSAPTRGNSGDDFPGSQIIRSGNASIKEDGFASWLWKAKWLILKEQTLTIHKNEVCLIAIFTDALSFCLSRSCFSWSFFYQTSPQQAVIYLRDIANIERTDLKPYCLFLETKDKKYWLSLKNDEEVYGWQDDIYQRSPLMGVSNPTNFVHQVHVGFDAVTGHFTVRSSNLLGCSIAIRGAKPLSL